MTNIKGLTLYYIQQNSTALDISVLEFKMMCVFWGQIQVFQSNNIHQTNCVTLILYASALMNG